MKKHQFFLDLWLWWVALSMFYVLTMLASLRVPTILSHVSGYTGLFVPTVYAFNLYDNPIHSQMVIYTIPLTLFVIAAVDWFLWKRPIHPLFRILLNLTVLFLLTYCTDMIVWQEWRSWDLAR